MTKVMMRMNVSVFLLTTKNKSGGKCRIPSWLQNMVGLDNPCHSLGDMWCP